MEATMNGSLDKSGETADQSIYRGWRIGVFVFPVLLVAVLVEFAIAHPDFSKWISQAGQTAFASPGPMPAVAPTEIRAGKAN
jgi:hypothetical protein